MPRTSIYFLLGLLSISSLSLGKFNPDPNLLFKSSEPIKLIIQMDMVKVLNDKSEDPEYSSAYLIQLLEGNQIKKFNIKIKARGNTRRTSNICEFPLLKINFKKESTLNSVFEGQDKIKMVTHCREDEKYQNYAMLEYLVYKTYNILSDMSYQVRLVDVIYQDTEQKYPDIHKTGFLLEDEDLLAERIGGEITDKRIWSPDSCQAESYNIFSVFQFMIGNTDWWIHTRHNVDIIKVGQDELIPIPFDFDYAGIINTPYAIPSSQLPIKSVQERFFKGSCEPFDYYQETIKLFNEKKESIIALWDDADFLHNRFRKKSLEYLEEFYEIINNHQEFSEYLSEYCEFINNPPNRVSVKPGQKNK